MILVDTSIWADHLRRPEPEMQALLDDGQVLMHPFVLGELALGHLVPRAKTLDHLRGVDEVEVASAAEVLSLVESAQLMGSGIGYVDAHLLASAGLSAVKLWTRDRKLEAAAMRLGVNRLRH